MDKEPAWVREGLSYPRFAPYLAKTGGDSSAAIELYWWNIGISAAFYTPLHCLEIALRNAVHRQLTIEFDRADWWALAPLDKNGRRMIDDASDKLAHLGRDVTADDVVAKLSLGFWVSCISATYDRILWRRCLHKAFACYRGPRRPLHTDLRTILLFRNRIMHHEPIHHRHLDADHRTILRLLGYLSPGLVVQLEPHDQVQAMLGRRPGGASRGVSEGVR